MGNDKTDKDNIKEELADVMTYCLYLCEYYDFDVKVIILDKINKNRKNILLKSHWEIGQI